LEYSNSEVAAKACRLRVMRDEFLIEGFGLRQMAG
jgi:hypothetical protein